MGFEFPHELSGHSFLKTKREAEPVGVETIKENCPENKKSNCPRTLGSPSDDVSFSRSSLLAQIEEEIHLYKLHAEAVIKSSNRLKSLYSRLDATFSAEHSISALKLRSHEQLSSPNPSFSAPKHHLAFSSRPVDSLSSLPLIKIRYFPKKPHCLILKRTGTRHLGDFFSSSLDGSIQLSTYERKSIKKSIHLPSFTNNACHAESMCILSDFECLIISTVINGTDSLNQTRLSSSLLRIDLEGLEGDAKIEILSEDAMPHRKAIGSLYAPEMFDRNCDFFSGGLDKNVVRWRPREQSIRQFQPQELHSLHTSAVQALVQIPNSKEVIWSGGADCRLIGWSMKSQTSIFCHKFSDRVSQLITNVKHPNLLLAALSKRNLQLQLLDPRASVSEPVLCWGIDESCTTSRYMRPSWSPDGNLIAFGSGVPLSGQSSLNVWDIRLLKKSQRPKFCTSFPSGKRFLHCEFTHNNSGIFATATDCSANFVDLDT